MALSKMASWGGAAALLVQGASAAYLQFPVYDSNDRPTEFKDGLPTYVRLTRDYGMGEVKPLEQFLLCTSCTISYIFGTLDDFEVVKSTEMMKFNGGSDPIPVRFVSVDLQIYADDVDETPFSWNMDIGYIDPVYQTSVYFDYYKENMLGLAPMLSEDPNLLARQFLYTFTTTGDQVGLNLTESYAFNGGEYFSIGGTVEDWHELVCEGGAKDEGKGFTNRPIVKEDAISEGTYDMNFGKMLYYNQTDLMLKFSNYIPPMKEELQQQVLAVDTWNRELRLPYFFYNYFMDTFMLPAYTCDPLRPQDLEYPGLGKTSACYCNNGDYHSMPTINFEVRNKGMQFDIDPSMYMFLPYLNYTQPMSLCILGVSSTVRKLDQDYQYAALGQRQMASFPFFTVYDREKNTVTAELGGATMMGGEDKVGIHVFATSIILTGLVVMLVYLITLRHLRLKAEEWLEKNHDVIFNHAKNLKTENEIIDSLVEHQTSDEILQNPNQLETPVIKNSYGKDLTQSLVGEGEEHTMQGATKNHRSSSSASSKKLDSFKQFSEKPE